MWEGPSESLKSNFRDTTTSNALALSVLYFLSFSMSQPLHSKNILLTFKVPENRNHVSFSVQL